MYQIQFVFLCVVLISVSVSVQAEESVSTANGVSSYGERLADSSSYVFSSSAFNREPKEDTGVYSSGINAILNSDGFLGQMEKFNNNEPKYIPNGPVEAAVHTKKTIEVIPVRFEEPKEGEPQVIEISPYEVPLSIVFKTQTNKIQVNQEHKSESAEEVKETNSEEEPHRVVHNVYRPVIQEVTEVIQPYRKVLQKVEPVIEQMKTIISKAGPPPPGEQYSSSSSGGTSFTGTSKSMLPQEENRFSRYGGNELTRGGINIIPMAYGSEMIKKLTSPPNESEISRRYGISNRNQPRVETQQTPTEDNLNESSDEKKGNYNELIKEYIAKFLEPKRTQQPNSPSQQINADNIKLINVPTKRLSYLLNGKNGASNEQDRPRFKVLKEFRVTLEDLKKMNLAPLALSAKDTPQFVKLSGDQSSNNRGHNKSGAKTRWTTFSIPLSAGSFKPLRQKDGKSDTKQTSSCIHNSLKRIGDTFVPRKVNNAGNRNKANLSKRRGFASKHNVEFLHSRPRVQSRSALIGISPPNLIFGKPIST